ncbi:MAG: hypothetical protein CL942_04190 [Desulfovibrio sp.]|nr:hypothetical protein [Desulfovibrio sp.]|tara:strand:+ start:2704 stop:2910 length:207 start_codon:yes stop_codon:yes gene_type:complete
MTTENWLALLHQSDIDDIPQLLDSAPDAIQQFRGAWENHDFSIQIQCVAAICFIEGYLAGHPTLAIEG